MMTEFTVHTTTIPVNSIGARRRRLVLVGAFVHAPLPMNATADHWIHRQFYSKEKEIALYGVYGSHSVEACPVNNLENAKES